MRNRFESLADLFGGIDQQKLKNIGWMLGLQGVTIFGGLILMVIMARSLGPERLAAYAWLFSLVMLVIPLTAAIDPIVVKNLVSRPNQRNEILGSMLVLTSAGALLGTIIVAAIAAIAGPEGTSVSMALVAALLLPAFVIAGFDSSFRARERIDLVAIPKGIAQMISALAAIVFGIVGAGLAAFVWLRPLHTLFSSLVTAWLYVRTKEKERPFALTASTDEIIRLFKHSWPLVLSMLVVTAHLRIDQVMLGWVSSAGELANYSLAARLAELMVIVPVALRSAFYPSLVRAFESNPDGFDEHMQRYYDLHSLLGFLGAIGLVVAASFLFVPVFGSPYAGGVIMAVILAIMIPFNCLNASRDSMLMIRTNTGAILGFALLGLAVNVVFNLGLIPLLGGVGAAIATIISVCAVFLATWATKPTRSAATGLKNALNVWQAFRRIAVLSRKA